MRADQTIQFGMAAESGIAREALLREATHRLDGLFARLGEGGGEGAQARTRRRSRSRGSRLRTPRGRTAALAVAASAPNIAAEMMLPFALASASISNATTRLAANSAAIEHDGGIADAVAGRLLFRHGESAMRRGDQGRAIGRDEAAQHGAARLHQLRRP